jgi:threonyl-tRNA synthetase
MNCPGHILIFKQGIKSYRDLPLRYGEFGQCHRNEPTGRLARHHAGARLHSGRRPHLLHRKTRSCDECVDFTALLQKVYKDLWLYQDIIYKVATRPAQRIGSDEIWDKAEHALMESLRPPGCEFEISPGRRRFLRPQDRIHA